MIDEKVVYVHKKPCGTVFYIGKGSIKRPYEKINRNKFWGNIVKKHGYSVEIVVSGLSNEDATKWEIYLIQLFGRKDLGEGQLVNMTNGGEGTIGRKASDYTKKLMSNIHKGKKLSESHIQSIRVSNTGRKVSDKTREMRSFAVSGSKNPMFGKKISDCAKKIISESSSKKVIDTSIDVIYKSAKDCASALGVNYKSLIRKLNGGRPNNSTLRYL